MTNQENLEKAIRKAIAGGWKAPVDEYTLSLYKKPEWGITDLMPAPEMIIFNHDFAKALWPGGGNYIGLGDVIVPDWQYHLQQMVVANDPIKYLGENI